MQPYSRKPKEPKEEDYGQEVEQFFDESQEEGEVGKKEEFEEVNQICERGREQLKVERTRGASKMEVEEKQESQFVPNSGSNDESSSPASKIDSESARNLMALIRESEADLRDPRLKMQKIRELSSLTRLSHEVIRKKVYDFLRRRKQSSKNSTPEQKFQHQTIYRKTEMFDDAIKRVLKVTPYACINDLKEEIYKKLNLDLAKETLIRRLKNLNYTYTKFSLDKKSHGPEDLPLREIRRKYLKNYKEILSKGYPINFYGTCHIAIDECRGSMWMKSKEGGALDHILYEKDVVNVCLILSKDRIEYYKIFLGFYKRENYLKTIFEWAEQREEAKNPSKPNRAYCYLYSEVSGVHNEGSLHDENEVSSGLLDLGVLQIPFPPYSYSINPAEQLFNQLKYLVKSKVKQFQNPEFLQSVEHVINNNLDIEDTKFAFTNAAQEHIRCC